METPSIEPDQLRLVILFAEIPHWTVVRPAGMLPERPVGVFHRLDRERLPDDHARAR